MVITEHRERWEAAGSPPVPTLVVGGTPHVLQHPSRGRGAARPRRNGAARRRSAGGMGHRRDRRGVAGARSRSRRGRPCRSRCRGLARTPLDLGVDSLVGIAALTRALSTGWFHWPGNPDTGETGDATVVGYQASIVDDDRQPRRAPRLRAPGRDRRGGPRSSTTTRSSGRIRSARFSAPRGDLTSSACSRRSASTRRSTTGRRRRSCRSVAGRCRSSTSRTSRASSCPNSSTNRAA